MQNRNLVFGTPFAVGKDKAVDNRWHDLSKPPVSNGPLTFTTPPAHPSFSLPTDGQLVEFALSYPMHVVELCDWPALNCKLGNRSIKIHKPIPIQSPYQPKEMIGNEPPDTFCSIIRVSCDHDASLPFPSAVELWPLVERLCEWIRIKCRHYWLLHGQAGFSATMHASVLTQESDTISQKNVVGYGRNLIVLPMDIELWKSIETEITSNIDPPVSEALFCDAMVSAFGGDEIKTVLELGVAAEVEITDLLTTAAKMLPVTSAKKKFLKQQSKFVPKLCEWPQKLGLDVAEQFMQPGFPPDWVGSMRELYRFRNSVAHSGKIRGSAPMQHLFRYITAASALLAFSRSQRIKFGMPHYSYPAGRAPFGQILLYRGGIMTGETNTSTGQKA